MTRLGNALTLITLFFASLILFTWGIRTEEVIGFDSRFYLFALEMWRHGPSYFPMTYHQYYPDYPATSTFLIYLVALIAGEMNKLVAVLPSAIAAALSVVMTYMIGASENKRWGWGGVFFLFMTLTFLKSARSLALDMYPTLITAGCFYLVYSADRTHQYARVWWIYPLMSLSFAFRGPIGLVIPAAVVGVYYLLDLRIKKMLIVGLFSLLLLCGSTLILLLLARYVGGDNFLQDVLHMEVVGRMGLITEPFYFYFTSGMKNYALSFPLAFLTLFGCICTAIKTKNATPQLKFIFKLVAWMLVVLIGMSIPGGKKIRYVLPVMPAVALLASYIFIAEKSRYFNFLRAILSSVLLVFPGIFALATALVYHVAKQRGFDLPISYLTFCIWLLVLQACGLCVYYRATKCDMRIIFLAAISFVTTYIAIIEPIELYVDRARDFVMAVEAKRTQQHAALVFYRETHDSLPIKYLINMPQEEAPIFIDKEETLMNFVKPAYFVASESYYAELPERDAEKFEMVAQDTLGHVRVVVFKRKEAPHD